MFGGYVYFLFSSVLRPVFRNQVTEKMEESQSKQTIKFSGTDPDPTFPVHSRDVEIISASGNTTNGISRFKASNIVDYCWEERFYTGQMLAVHRSGKYVAYGIKGKSKSQCTIRIVNRESSNRALMKDAEGMIEDLSFAQTPDVILLACVDNTGTLLVYHITENATEISSRLILHVMPDESAKKSIPYRVFWCSYIPEEDFEDDDGNKLLAITRNNKVELWDIGTISPNLEPTSGPIKSGDVKEGYLVIEAHKDLITEAVFSPDGTAIATASLDGTCKFYQVYMPPGEAESRCLHQWAPHHGKPVTMLFFLDDLRKFNPEVQFWKYAVTATDNNCELKLWSCETWQCLQHIKFKNTGSLDKKFKIGLDISASVIVINDMPNKILYIMELNKGEIQNTIPYVASVTELRLHYAILSFGIVEASIGPHHPTISPALDQPATRINGESDELGVMIRMYIVQPKSLQSCDIAYPTKRSNIPLPSPVPNEYENGNCVFDGVDGGDAEPVLPLDTEDQELQEEVVNCAPLTPPPPPINLMTPDAFSSSHSHSSNTLEQITAREPFSPKPIEKSISPSVVQAKPQPDNPPQVKSGGSSPSREVQEILALKNMTFYPADQVPPPSPPQIPQQQFNHKRVVTCEDKSVGPAFSVAELSDLKNDINSLVHIMKKQSHEIQELKSHIKTMENKEHNNDIIGKILERHHNQMIDKMNSHQEETVSHICQLVDNSISTKLPPLIQSQLHNMINPAIKELKELIHKEMTIKLTATDSLLKDNIAKMVKSKALIEAMAHSVAAVGKEGITQLCKEALTQTLPKIEKVCSTMMADMAETFTNGTSQYVGEVETQVKRLTEHWHMEVTNLHQTFLAQANAQSIQTIEKAFVDMEDRLYKKLSKTLIKAVNTGVSSRVMTPAVGSSTQADILELVNQGHFIEAFQQALSAAELPLVMFLCEKVAISQLFTSTGSLLPQPILLSLIQQLSADMSTHSETKHRYLEEAVMNLNTKNLVTREHMPVVLNALNKQLQQFISQNPTSPLVKRVKMLQMATQSLLNN